MEYIFGNIWREEGPGLRWAGDSICHNCDFFVTNLNPGVSRVPWELLSVEKQKQKTFKPDLSSRARQVLLCIPFKER